jgi:hypothetical protein
MKNFFISFCFLLFTSNLMADSLQKQADDILSLGVGVAAAGLGGAFTANGNDMSVVYYNPARLAALSADEIASNYWSLPQNSRLLFLGFAYGLDDSNKIAISGTQFVKPNDKIDVLKNIIHFAYGGALKSLGINYGVSLKYLYYAFGNDNTAAAGAMDFGLHYILFNNDKGTIIETGLGGLNLLSTEMKIKEVDSFYPQRILKFGLGFKTRVVERYNKEKDSFTLDTIRLALDWGQNYQSSVYAFGIEYSLANRMMFRAGVNNAFLSLGLGINIGTVQLDYAYSPKNATNQIGFIYKWGQSKKVTYSRTQTITEDFQEVYQKANRLYNRYLRDSINMIEANKTKEALLLLNKTVPLNPKDSEARKLIEIAQQKLIAQEVDKHIETAQKLRKNGNNVKAYEELLKALSVSPSENIKLLLSDLYNDKNATIKNLRAASISKFEKSFDEYIEIGNFKDAEIFNKKLSILITNEKYFKKLNDYKELYIGRCLRVATESKDDVSSALNYYNQALALDDDAAIKYQRDAMVKSYLKKKRFTSEEKMYSEKLYYLAAIALATDDKPKEAYEDITNFNAAYEYTSILEEYLIKNNILKKLLP